MRYSSGESGGRFDEGVQVGDLDDGGEVILVP